MQRFQMNFNRVLADLSDGADHAPAVPRGATGATNANQRHFGSDVTMTCCRVNARIRIVGQDELNIAVPRGNVPIAGGQNAFDVQIAATGLQCELADATIFELNVAAAKLYGDELRVHLFDAHVAAAQANVHA